MAYFVIADGLLQRLKASAPARIVSTASDAHKMRMLDFDDLQSVLTRGICCRRCAGAGPDSKFMERRSCATFYLPANWRGGLRERA